MFKILYLLIFPNTTNIGGEFGQIIKIEKTARFRYNGIGSAFILEMYISDLVRMLKGGSSYFAWLNICTGDKY